MTSSHNASFFERLIAPMLRHLRHIAKLTRGEHSVDDLKSEAWIIAEGIRAERGGELDPEDAGLQETIVTRLHKLFGQFVNRAMRFAVRLDQEDHDDDGKTRENSLAARLAGPVHYEPHRAIEREEELTKTEQIIAAQFSEAVAYFHMFDQFDGDSGALASYLAIESRTLRTRLRRAEQTARDQPSAFDNVATIPSDFMARRGTWRRQPALSQFQRVCGSARPTQLHLFLRFGNVFGPTTRRYAGRPTITAIDT
ncbi:hypothetical protein DF024_00330 [Burkholderia cenocepacia]|nr:hypothetical protein DF024_00330 [Burkholderia cenocepacia]